MAVKMKTVPRRYEKIRLNVITTIEKILDTLELQENQDREEQQTNMSSDEGRVTEN